MKLTFGIISLKWLLFFLLLCGCKPNTIFYPGIPVETPEQPTPVMEPTQAPMPINGGTSPTDH